MQLYQWLCLFGVPGLFTALVGFVVSQVNANKAMKKGIQAMLRDRLLQEYKEFARQGYAEPDDRTNFCNMYDQYHNLGSNGMMTDIYNKFLQLPVYPAKK